MTVRFFCLTAVSTEKQAEDKDSLDDQLRNAMIFGEHNGGVFMGEFRIEGYSRSGYFDLTKAFQDIPRLGEMSRAIASRQADMIVVDSFDRLGSVALSMYEWLKPFRVQLRSFQQPTPVFDPDAYEWRHDNGTYKMIVMSLLDQDYRIGKIIRAFAVGNSKRARDGKYPNGFPTGFTKAGEWDGATKALLIKMKDEFLAGATLDALAEMANNSGIKPKRSAIWRGAVIHGILRNPFYAGKVFYGRYKTTKKYISVKGKRTNLMKPNASYTMYDAQHEPLWTWDDHLRILEEFEQRYRHQPRHNPTNFSGLLICGECGKHLKLYNGKYACYPLHESPVRLGLEEANAVIGRAMVEALKGYKEDDQEHKQVNNTDAIAGIERQIVKVQDLALQEVYTAAEAKDKVAALRQQIDFIKSSVYDEERRRLAKERFTSKREELLLIIDDIPEILKEPEGERNNRFLRDLLRGIKVNQDSFDFDWKD